MAILNELTVVGNTRNAGSLTLGTSGNVALGDSKAVTGAAVYNAMTTGVTITANGDNKYSTVLDMTLSIGSATTVNGGITLHLSCDKTPSSDAGNTNYNGSNGIVYVKFTGTSSALTVIPEWPIRNGCRNGDCAAGGYISGGVLYLRVGVRCMKYESSTVWTVKLLHNDSPYSITSTTWYTTGSGTNKDSYLNASPYYIKQGITSGKVLLSKWAGDDCSMESDGHALDWTDDNNLYALGFSISSSNWDNLNNLLLFPEHQSKYTVYTNTSSTSKGWPVGLNGAARCTISKVACISKLRATNGDAYWIEQEAEMIAKSTSTSTAADSNILNFKRSGYVSSVTASSASVTWGPWVGTRMFAPPKAYSPTAPTSQSANTTQTVDTYTQWNIPCVINIGYGHTGSYYDTARFVFPKPDFSNLNCTQELKFQLYMSGKARIEFKCGNSSVVFGDWPSGEAVPSGTTCSNSNVTGTYSGYAFYNRSGSLCITWTHKSNYQKTGCVVLE